MSIDYEQSRLVLYRHKTTGKFHKFQWVDKDRPANLEDEIRKYNELISTEYSVELVVDETIREICAYKEKSEPILELLKDIRDVYAILDGICLRTSQEAGQIKARIEHALQKGAPSNG